MEERWNDQWHCPCQGHLSWQRRLECGQSDERERYPLLYGFHHGLGIEPWQSDGTAAGTHMVQDIYAGLQLQSHQLGCLGFLALLYGDGRDPFITVVAGDHVVDSQPPRQASLGGRRWLRLRMTGNPPTNPSATPQPPRLWTPAGERWNAHVQNIDGDVSVRFLEHDACGPNALCDGRGRDKSATGPEKTWRNLMRSAAKDCPQSASLAALDSFPTGREDHTIGAEPHLRDLGSVFLCPAGRPGQARAETFRMGFCRHARCRDATTQKLQR